MLDDRFRHFCPSYCIDIVHLLSAMAYTGRKNVMCCISAAVYSQALQTMQTKTTNHFVSWLNLTISVRILQFSINWWQSCLLIRKEHLQRKEDAALEYRLHILQRSWLWSQIIPRIKSCLRHRIDGKSQAKNFTSLSLNFHLSKEHRSILQIIWRLTKSMLSTEHSSRHISLSIICHLPSCLLFPPPGPCPFPFPYPYIVISAVGELLLMF